MTNEATFEKMKQMKLHGKPAAIAILPPMNWSPISWMRNTKTVTTANWQDF
jgi:hypothetical protein